MKSRLLLVLFAFTILFPTSNVFAPPNANPDWPSAPYYPGPASIDFYKEGWAEYYDYKGAEWMETKKQEMFTAIEDGTLGEWSGEPTMAHSNVRTYYFYQGEIPNYEGKFIDQVIQEKFFSDMEHNLKNNQFPLGDGVTINFTFLLTVIAGIVIGIVFVIRRKRK
ncbi:hypothetical protein [Nitrosopumilus ureiphilus]|uniref:Uncharacterized protein n=1 Tax=Nitrosopumilus ureiphilus TaxID=1470067 RepID=A0A7D5RG87_9ARCH|nr:hypothetical protein [Nitrosopumilus ureiphilus]QLH06505.1 hypothetical protein C5F50_05030 [Nitrosopumilus ureiphilus]